MSPTEKLQQLKIQSDRIQDERTALREEISKAVIEVYKQHIKYEDDTEKVRIAPRKFINKPYRFGYVEYVQIFKDEDTGEGLPVTLKHYVWKDDKWYNTDDINFCLEHLI